MTTLYVQEQGAIVRKKDQQILVIKEGQTLQVVPLAKIDQVVLMGRGVQMTTALMVDLIQRGIPITLTNEQGSRHYATLTAGPSRFGELRSRQIALVNDPARALELARSIVQAKLTNQRSLLQSTGWNAASAAVAQLDAALASVVTAPTIDMVRGFEGTGAAAYFGAWRIALPATWSFGGRAYYPPTDPVNALLSFGYTLALNDVMAAVQISGLDPYLGTFHVIETGRPSLALDLLEEFRPLIIDRMVIELLRANAISRAQFERPATRPEAVYLTQAGRALVLERYEDLMNSSVPLAGGERTFLRRVILLQTQAMARVMRGEQERYRGYTP